MTLLLGALSRGSVKTKASTEKTGLFQRKANKLRRRALVGTSSGSPTARGTRRSMLHRSAREGSRTLTPRGGLEALRSNRKHPKRGEERRQCLEVCDIPGVDDARSMNGKGRNDGIDGRRAADLPQCHAG